MKFNIKEARAGIVPVFRVDGEKLIIGDDILDFSTLQNGEKALNDGSDNIYFQEANRDSSGVLTVNVIFPYSPETYEKDKVILNSIEVMDGIVNPYGVAT